MIQLISFMIASDTFIPFSLKADTNITNYATRRQTFIIHLQILIKMKYYRIALSIRPGLAGCLAQ